jgi:DNA-binding SARP family transcriptional activator
METVRVRVLGAFEVEGIEASALGSRKARTLLKLLALARGRPTTADAIVDALWPDPSEMPAKPTEQVSVLVSRLRGVLGADRLTRTDAGYVFSVDWLDIEAAAALCEEAERRLSSGAVVTARTAAAAATALVRGTLLPDEEDAAWAETERASAKRLVTRIRLVTARAALRTNDGAAALEAADAILADDPYDEAALRAAMEAYVALGNQAAALQTYEGLRERLADDLGADPAAETRDLHARILRQEPALRASTSQRSLAGREAELAELTELFERNANGIVLIEGDAGIGKTTLLDAWCERAVALGASVLRARCDALDRTLPLEAVVDALSYEIAPPETTDQEVGRLTLFTSLVDELRTHRPPVVFAIDDFHLAGSSTAEWVAFASRRLANAMFVLARRTGEGPSPDEATTISLGPLSIDAAREIVGDERADAIYERSGGNALFLVELASAPDADELPASVLDAVAARCNQAGEAAATLRSAAVIGPDVDLDILAGILDATPVQILDHLEDGVRRGFLVEARNTFSFRHELVREALIAGMGAARRAYIHRQAGRALAARPDPDPLVIAQHARHGGDHAMAARSLARAADIALQRFDAETAVTLLDQAIALADDAELRLARARVRIARNDNDGAIRDAQQAIALGGGAPAMEMAGLAAYYGRDFSVAVRMADDGLRLADDDETRAGCYAVGGRVRHVTGDLRHANEDLERAAAMVRGPRKADVFLWLAALRVHQGRVNEGIDAIDVSLRVGTSMSPNAPIVRKLTEAHALATIGHIEEALIALDGFDTERDRRHAVRYLGRSDNYRGWILRNLAETTQADELNTKAFEDATRINYAEAQAFSLFDRAGGAIDRGDPDEAAALLNQTEPLLRVQQALAWRQQLRGQLLWGRVHLLSGRFEDAIAAAAAVDEDATHLGARRYTVLARLLGAEARLASGGKVDEDAVGADLVGLGDVAALEAWWITADIARAARSDAWMALAERHAASLAERAGDRADGFRRAVDRRLARQR